MKLSTKPISSPGRAEKYPPPLMRFLRSNVGSKSRGRSRSSPMFVRRKSTAIETQEPTSPKVTCMGQVRVRRSKQAKTRPRRRKRRCKCIQNSVFCHPLNKKFKVRSFGPAWSKCVLSFCAGFKKKSRGKESSNKFEQKFSNKKDDLEQESIGKEGDEDESKVCVSAAASPPKNALLLTRCRSAPYRSSSLACRFWGSPVSSEETEQKHSASEHENRANNSPVSKRESVSEESNLESSLDPQNQEKVAFFKENEDSTTSIRETSMKSEKNGELETEEGGPRRPLILTRCKSEPARTGEKLVPETSFWKERRLGLT